MGGTTQQARWRYVALAVGIALVALVVYSWATDPTINAAGGCDNLAGECIRGRQQTAKFAIWLVMLALGIACAVWGARGGATRWTRWRVAVVVLALLVTIGYAAVRPDEKFNNRFTGWLHATVISP